MKQTVFRKIIGVCAAVMMVVSMISLEVLDVYAITPTYTVSSDYKSSKYYANLKNLTLTGNQRSDVVRVALTQLGYHEGNSDKDFAGGNTKGSRNFVEYNRYHGKLDNNEGNGTSYGYYWCASFSTWCAVQAGIPSSIVPSADYIGVSTQRMREWFIGNASYHLPGTYTPITGDYIFYKSATAIVPTNHVGLVLYVKGDTVYAIEGNAGGDDCVALKEYKLTDSYIVGYGVPNYRTGNTVAVDLTNKSNPGEYVTTASSLAFRSGAGTSYTALDAVPQTTVVTVSEVSGNWGKITYNGQTGWISLNYALPLSLPTITVSYDANGGAGAPSSQGKIAGTPIALSSKVPTRAGYTFLGWSTSSTATKALYASGGSYTADQSIKLYAVWKKETYVIEFVDHDGTVLQSRTYSYGDTVTEPAAPKRKSDQTYTYTFSGWDKKVTDAQANVTYQALYDTKYIEYSVVFCDDDGTVLSAQTYHYQDNVTDMPLPEKASDDLYSYTFIGWGEPVGRVTGDKVYTAVYDKTYLNYLITFADENGVILSQEMYHYGDTVKQPSAPKKASDAHYDYIFTGWDKNVSKVEGMALYTAVYEKQERKYTVVFQNRDGEILAQTKHSYGDPITPPADPTMKTDERYEYTFSGWSADGTAVGSVLPVTADATYTAIYTTKPVEYTVTFRDESGHVYASETYHYGDKITPPANPVKPSTAKFSYRFRGWDETVAEQVTGDAVYVAVFEEVPAQGNKKPWISTVLSPDQDGNSIPVFGISLAALAFLAIVIGVVRFFGKRR